MLKKALVAAGLVLAVVAAAPQQASAKTTVNIGIGVGGGYACGPYNNWCGRPWVGPRPGRLSCKQGARIVWNHGFNRVMPLSCGWKVYVYDATRGGRHWRVKVNPWNGRMWF